jgi:hypothetical protein
LDGIAEALKRHAPGLYDAIQAYVADPKDPQPLEKTIDSFLANVPPGYYPAEKLTRTLEMVRSQGVEGIVIFSAGGITSLHLWDAVEEFFSR